MRRPDKVTLPPVSVAEALADLFLNPWRRLLLRWNWKTALLSACVRGTIFFIANPPGKKRSKQRVCLASERKDRYVFRSLSDGVGARPAYRLGSAGLAARLSSGRG